MVLSGAEIHCLIPSFIHSSARRHTQLQWMQLLLTAVGDDEYKVLTWIHICQPQFAGDHHCPCLGHPEAKFICDVSLHWPQQDYNQVWSRICFFHKVGFKVVQVLQCLASCYHLDIMVYVKYFICKTHRVEIFMAGCLKKHVPACSPNLYLKFHKVGLGVRILLCVMSGMRGCDWLYPSFTSEAISFLS